jgi:hypothetical protein
MAGGPTPQTQFEAWPQALIGITNTKGNIAEYKKGLLALIMIADIKEEWAAWYYFTSDSAINIQVLTNYTSPSEILAEKPKFPSHFTTRSPMRVGELCGRSDRSVRRAALVHVKRDEPSLVELLLAVQSAPLGAGPMNEIKDYPTTHPVHLRFKRRDGASDVTDYPLGFGTLAAVGLEENFNFLWPYHSMSQKLRAIEDMLLRPGGQVLLGPGKIGGS